MRLCQVTFVEGRIHSDFTVTPPSVAVMAEEIEGLYSVEGFTATTGERFYPESEVLVDAEEALFRWAALTAALTPRGRRTK